LKYKIHDSVWLVLRSKVFVISIGAVFIREGRMSEEMQRKSRAAQQQRARWSYLTAFFMAFFMAMVGCYSKRMLSLIGHLE
jgi:hypothetical protein